jgi:hypothetical protein
MTAFSKPSIFTSEVCNMTDVHEPERMAAELKRIRSLRVWLAWILITYVPVVVFLFIIRLPEWVIIAACLAWVGTGVVTAFMIGFARCPACGQYFHVRGGGSLFAKNCLHCGIPLQG